MVTEREQELLAKFKPVLQAFLHDHLPLQVTAIYALQVFTYTNNFPKGIYFLFTHNFVFWIQVCSVQKEGLNISIMIKSLMIVNLWHLEFKWSIETDF